MTTTPVRRTRRGTAAELARKFGVSERTIRYTVAEERAVYEARADERRAQIVEEYRQGLGVRAIARKLGVSAGLVSTRLKEARDAGLDLSRLDDDAAAS